MTENDFLGLQGEFSNPEPGVYEKSFHLFRVKELALYFNYEKGDESMVVIEPLIQNKRLGDGVWYALGLAKSINPIRFDPYFIKLTDPDGVGEQFQSALPHCVNGTLMKIRVTFRDLNGGSEGSLTVGVVENQL